MTEAAALTPPTSLAVVGLACRFPDADDPPALLDVVLTGRRAFRRVPPGRLNLADYYRSDPATSDATYSTRAAVIDGWRFDRAAFGVDPTIYYASDPAHWLALETAARALAAAGLPAGAGLDRDRTGVIIGNTLTGDTSRANALRVRWPYVRRTLGEALDAANIPPSQARTVLRRAERRFLAPFPAIGPDSLAGSMPATIAATISAYFGFRGGSHAVDSASSSSLQAVASACSALAAGELDAAIAGGVDLSLDPLELIGLAKAGVLATSDVRLYDRNPSGYLPGEGCGVVVLLRTADARAAGLPVHAEILGWGTSSGGLPGQPRSQASSQLLAMRRAYDRAGVDPAEIHYLEGNGAGTPADDEAELAALAAIRAGARHTAALGSVKANIGHAQAAAGAAGLLKTVLAVNTGVVPPATGVVEPHSLITDGDARLHLPLAAQEWARGSRLAAVSATGIGGSNVHLVLRHEASRSRGHRDRAAPAAPVGVQRAPNGAPAPRAFLLHAHDRAGLATTLSQLADRAAWLSDSEMLDLACALGRDPAAQGPARVALVATRQEQLAALAREALGVLPGLTEGRITARPGIFASDGADGRLLLLMSGEHPAGVAIGPGATLGHCLDMLRWLDSLEVAATTAVGHGFGLLAGLAWAGVLGQSEVTEIAELRTRFLAKSAAQGATTMMIDAVAADWPPDDDADAAALRAAIAQRFRLGPPRRRLLSTVTGAEVRSVDEAVDLICRGFAGADRMTDAVAHGALGATLLLDTGPGQALANAAATIRVPTLSLRPGLADPLNTARVAAALFAAGALGAPQPLFATQQARPIDIWREPAFLTSPCEPAPRARRSRRAGDGPAPEDGVATTPMAAASTRPAAMLTGAGSAADALRRALEAAAHPAVSPAAVNGTARTLLNGSARTSAGGTAPTSANGSAPAADATEASAAQSQDPPVDTGVTSSDGYLPGGVGVPASQARSVAGLAAWSRCFAEGLHPVSRPPAPESSRAWRVFAAARSPRLADLGGQFAADPAAPRTLAVLEDPADPQSRSTAVAAARDAASTGELVVVTASPGFTGFFATLHAEQPSVGVTVLRVPSEALSAAVLLPFASAAPGQFRELVFAPTGAASEPVLTEVPLPGGADFPLGPDDVLVISRATGGAGLALARVLACSGTGIAMIGRADGHDDTELIVGLEELRSAGARIGYEIVDVADRASLISAIRRIEGRLGAVTAIAHAAIQDDPVPVLSISDPDARSHPAAEAGVLEALAGSVAAGQLKLIISIGTVAGRYGLAGAGLHALDCGAVASSAAELAAARTGCAALHLDLPAWRTGGLGERPGLAEQLAAADTPALDVGAGSRLLLRLMTTPALPRRLALHGRIGGLASRRPPVITAAELAVAGLPRGGRFLREVAVHYQGIELICTARLSLATDPYLADYQVDGIPVLPPVLALEALAQAASVLAGRPVRQARAVTLDSPVLIHPDGEAIVRICAQRAGDTIATALRSSGSSYRVDHATAEFSCTAPELTEAVAPASGLPQLAAAATGLVDGTELYGQVCFQSGRFRRIALLPEVTARSGRAIVRGADDQPWFAPGSELADTDLLLGSPGLHDAALQLLQACQPHRRVRPTGCESVHFSGRAESGPVEIRAVAEPVRMAAPPRPDSDAARVDGIAGWTPVVPGQPGAPGAEHDDGAGLVGGLGDVAVPAAADAASLLADAPADRAREQPPRSRHARRWRAEGGRQHTSGAGADQGVPGGAPAGPGPAGSRGAHERWSGEQLWSVEAVNAAGQLLACWRGVRLRDTGPLPRTAAWPPALLAVFLERGATDLGLDAGLRVTVSCGQPELTPDAIPRQSGGAELETPGGDGAATPDGEQRPRRRLLSTGRAAGLGPLGGYTMTVRAPVPAACGWITVDEDGRRHQPATGLAIAYGQLRAELDEPPAVLAGRLEAIRACLTAVGLHGEADLRVVHSAGARWVLLATRRARIACTVVELSGVAAPVAVALLTVRTHARTTDARPAAAVLT